MANNDSGGGFLAAIWRFFTFWKKRKVRRINEAADAQYTQSARGISDAYEDERDEKVRQYKTYREAIAGLLDQIEKRKTRLEKLEEQEETARKAQSGAFNLLSKAKDEGDAEAVGKYTESWKQLKAKIAKFDADEAELEESILEGEGNLNSKYETLKKLQKYINDLASEKADAISDHIANKAEIELNDRIAGMQLSFESGPLAAVRKRNADRAAQAKVSRRLANVDATKDEDELLAAAGDYEADNELEAMLAAREAETNKESGESDVPDKSQERPNI